MLHIWFKRPAGVAVLVLVVLSSAVIFAQPNTDQARLERAYAAGKASAAQKLLLAQVWITTGQGQKGIQLLRGMGSLAGPLQTSRELLRAAAHEQLQQPAEAKKIYEGLRTASPDDATVLLRYGVFEYRRGDLVRARQLLTRSLDRSPNNSECLYYLFTIDSGETLLARLVAADGPAGPWARKALAHVAASLP